MLLGSEYHLRFKESRFYHSFLMVTGFFLMISCLIPYETVLVPAVASNPKDWRKICAASVIGSALGAAALAAMFEHLGLPLMQHLFQDFERSKGWVMTAQWLGAYGPWAMAVIAALPIAQGPALAVAGLFKIPAYVILIAFLAGKSLKYSLISFLVARGEENFSYRIIELEKFAHLRKTNPPPDRDKPK